ncbi:hypothetical protein FQN53_007623 [Emmonsiellopsis sp. PD_33]|nr:hypothetical protein FQN53_007623 [Emmonsiellopsis sp. PD_33]
MSNTSLPRFYDNMSNTNEMAADLSQCKVPTNSLGPFIRLNIDCLLLILQNVEPHTLGRLKLVSSLWNKYISHTTSNLETPSTIKMALRLLSTLLWPITPLWSANGSKQLPFVGWRRTDIWRLKRRPSLYHEPLTPIPTVLLAMHNTVFSLTLQDLTGKAEHEALRQSTSLQIE